MAHKRHRDWRVEARRRELLLYIEEHPGATRREISSGTGMNHATVTDTLDTLFQRRLVSCEAGVRPAGAWHWFILEEVAG